MAQRALSLPADLTLCRLAAGSPLWLLANPPVCSVRPTQGPGCPGPASCAHCSHSFFHGKRILPAVCLPRSETAFRLCRNASAGFPSAPCVPCASGLRNSSETQGQRPPQESRLQTVRETSSTPGAVPTLL